MEEPTVVSWDWKYNPKEFPTVKTKDENGNDVSKYAIDGVDPSYYKENLQAIILPNKFLKLFGKYLEQGDITIPFILAGRPGHGKTALIEILIRLIGIGIHDYKIIDGSVDRGIDVVRNEIIEFANSTKSDVTKKIVFIDEADGFTPQAWNALKRVMKDTKHNCTYCFATNNEDDIPEAVKDSRTRVYSLVPRKKAELEHYKRCIMNRLIGIYDAEGIPVTNPRVIIPKIVNNWFPDIRQTLIASEESSIMYDCIDDNIFDMGDADIFHIVNKIKNFQLEPNDKKLLESLIIDIQEYDPSQWYSDMQHNALKIVKPASYFLFSRWLAEWRCKHGANPHLKIFACVCDLISDCKFI